MTKNKSYLVIPDSFKGSITSKEFIDIAKKIIKTNNINANIVGFPITDGGEGFVESMIELFQASPVPLDVYDSNFQEKKVTYAINNDTAYIATSSSSGLADAKIKNPLITTTYGLGQQVQNAINNGAKNVVLGLGGSSTNDAGVGMLSALGLKFFDKNNKEFIPTGGTLQNISYMDSSLFYKNIQGVKFMALCDVKNPLLGSQGCGYIFSPQKGANEDMVRILEDNMTYWANFLDNKKYSNDFAGAGSAGGLGYCIHNYFGGELISGIDYILNTIHFSEVSKNFDFVITGEGKLDSTSFSGKVVDGVCRLKDKLSKVVVFCGDYEDFDYREHNIFEVVRLNDKNTTLEKNINNTQKNLSEKLLEFFLKENV